MAMAMLHNELKGMDHRASFKHIFSPYKHIHLWVGLKGKTNLKFGHVAYQFKGKEIWTSIEANTLTFHTPLASGPV